MEYDMIKKLVFIAIISILLIGVVVAGCQPSTPSSRQGEVIKLRWSHGLPPMTVFHRAVFVPWAEELKERTTAIGMPVEVAFFPAASLAKIIDQYDLLLKGGADIVSMWGPQHFPGRMPLAEILNLPFLFPNSTAACLASLDLYEATPELREQYAEAKFLAYQPPAPYQFLSRTRHIKTLEDFKGLKVMARGGTDAETIKLLGGVPVTLQMPETYQALEKGIVDVGPLNWEGAAAFKWYEVTKYRTQLPRGLLASTLAISMNWDTWNSLPPEVQEIIDDMTGRVLTEKCGSEMDKADAALFDERIKVYDEKVGNPELYMMPKDELQRWIEAVDTIYEKKIQDLEAKGFPGRSTFEKLLQLAEKYS
jgi:TRAP-type C4-dicarboxylate transport system substrate-binding protein